MKPFFEVISLPNIVSLPFVFALIALLKGSIFAWRAQYYSAMLKTMKPVLQVYDSPPPALQYKIKIPYYWLPKLIASVLHNPQLFYENLHTWKITFFHFLILQLYPTYHIGLTSCPIDLFLELSRHLFSKWTFSTTTILQ